jgi:hypothetical protein
MTAEQQHEARVAEFLAAVASSASSSASSASSSSSSSSSFPVLTPFQMRHRQRREIPVGDASDVERLARRFHPCELYSGYDSGYHAAVFGD